MYDLRAEDLFHKSQLLRLLIEIVDNPLLAQSLAFKGGTCAAMLGYLDRFSADLDFDVLSGANEAVLREAFLKIFSQHGFELRYAFTNTLIFNLKYPSSPGKRNTLKVSANSLQGTANDYKVQYFSEIDRLINSQTIETMFANKLVAGKDRYSQHEVLAARDIYDIHHFFIQGYAYKGEIIRERTGLAPSAYFEQLVQFIKKQVTARVIDEDLNSLLPYPKFQQIRKILVPETIALLEREIARTAE